MYTRDVYLQYGTDALMEVLAVFPNLTATTLWSLDVLQRRA
jgi:hypothetical protein